MNYFRKISLFFFIVSSLSAVENFILSDSLIANSVNIITGELQKLSSNENFLWDQSTILHLTRDTYGRIKTLVISTPLSENQINTYSFNYEPNLTSVYCNNGISLEYSYDENHLLSRVYKYENGVIQEANYFFFNNENSQEEPRVLKAKTDTHGFIESIKLLPNSLENER